MSKVPEEARGQRGPLAGIRVVEIAEGIAGPQAGLLLADLGATVCKLEPRVGDRSRHWRTDEVTYAILNRNKIGAVLDEPAEAIELARQADVVIIDTDALTRWPDLGVLVDQPSNIVLRLSLFGATGPTADLPLSELSAQLLSEATASVGDADHPGRAGVDIGSTYAGIFGAQGICAALLADEPEVVDVSLVGSLLMMRSTLWVALSNPDEWWGFHLESYRRPPFRGYACADGRLYFDLRHAATVDWDGFLTELGLADVRDDPRSREIVMLGAGPGARFADAAQPLWERAFRSMTVHEVTAVVTRYGGDVFPVNTYDELLAAPQVAAAGNVAPASGAIPAHIRPPWQFSATPVPEATPAPILGTAIAAVAWASGGKS
jgi:crotonobetainyl-CoA:carnitine CoA-transferase CaiB-like acyl-CoA transferase